MERVRLTPLIEKGETVGKTHGEAVLSEAGALKVLTQTIGSDFWTLCPRGDLLECWLHLLEDLFLCSSQMFNVVDGCVEFCLKLMFVC